MSEQLRSQAQQITDFWTLIGKGVFAENASRIESFSMEMEKLQEKATEQAAANLDEVTRLAKESIAYGNELAAAWRKLVLDGTKRTADVVAAAPKG